MGCFIGDSQITIPGGKKAIRDIRSGDIVLWPQGATELATVKVLEVFESEEELIQLTATHGSVLATADQLFACFDGKYRKTQDLLGQFVGYFKDDKELVYVKVEAIRPQHIKAKVFHLHVDEPHTYLVDGFLVHNKGGGGNQEVRNEIAPELKPLFGQTGTTLQGLQLGQPTGSVLDQFLQPAPQFIPQATPNQQAIASRQQQRAFGPQTTVQEILAQAGFIGAGEMRPGEGFATNLSSTFPFLRPEESSAMDIGTGFGNLRFPEELALLQANELVGGPIGSSSATQAAMAAVTPRIQNEATMMGLGRSGAPLEALASAYGPIVAQEIAGRQAMIPQFFGLGQNLRTGDITQANQLTNIANAARQGSVQAAQIQAQIAQAQRTGDIQGAAQLAALGNQLVKRESDLLGEAANSEEALRELAAMQFQAFTQDAARRQQIAQQLTTGVLGGFPTVTGQTSISKTKGGGGSTIICTELYRQGLLDDETYQADQVFGRSMSNDVLNGYYLFGVPIVAKMAKSKLVTRAVALVAIPWAKEMRRQTTGKGKGSLFGRALLFLGIPLCRYLGQGRRRFAILGQNWR